MKGKLKGFCGALRRSLAIVVAMSMMLSICVISGISVAAQTSSDQKIYLNLNSATSTVWKNAGSIRVRFADANGSVLGDSTVSKSGGYFVATAPAGAVKAELSIPNTSVSLPTTVVANGKHRIYLKKTGSINYTSPYIWYYDGNSAACENSSVSWPGLAMTSIDSNYCYIDVGDSYKTCNFSNNGSPQTDDLTFNFSYSSNVAYYNNNSSNPGWTNPYVVTLDLSSVNSSNSNPIEYYMSGNYTFKSSKYLEGQTHGTDYNTNSGAVTFKCVYVYNANWNSLDNIYVTYDYNDVFRTTVKFEKDTSSVPGITLFKGEIPEGASVRFHPNSGDINGASNATTYPSSAGNTDDYSATTAAYRITNTSQGWCSRSDIKKATGTEVASNFTQSNIVGVNATYIDYLSDVERSGSYLYNQSYDSNSIENWWYQFDDFNAYISNNVKSSSVGSTWSTPLYFGNLYNNSEWNTVFKSHVDSLYNFKYSTNAEYAVNNSNGMTNGGGKYTQSLQGLVYNQLDKNGDIQAVNGFKLPYFDTQTLVDAQYNSKNVAKVYQSYFPFRATTNSSGVTTYSFDSTNATDNVYFTWNSTTPVYVNYGSGTNYGVKDANNNFGGSQGYGIFPFNVNDSLKTQTITKVTRVDNIAADEILLRSDASTYYMYLFGSTVSGETDKHVALTTKETRNGASFFVIKKADLGGYTKCIFKPNSGTDWTSQTNDLTISTLYGKAWVAQSSSSSKYTPAEYAVSSSSNTYTRGGNTALDYGFGIRLDIDFKVPANGTLNGTTSGTPVTFNYTGDDDLWVFIGEESDGSDGKLVLDLGGDHKQTKGNINFNTMKATVEDSFHNYGSESYTSSTVTKNIPSDEFWVSTSYSDFCLYVWSDTSVGVINNGGCYITPDRVENGYAKFKKSQIGNNTECVFCKWQNVDDGKVSGDSNIVFSNIYGKKVNLSGTSLGTTYTVNTLTKQFNNGVQLDPNKTYHMTVFYMERGESESNFSVDFTMTPASNDLKVNKALDTGNVVTEIADDLKTNEAYSYTISDGSTASATKTYNVTDSDSRAGKSVTAGSKTMSIGSDKNGTFTLQDSQTAEFDNAYATDSSITVNETLANTALSYNTAWTLINNTNGSTLSSGTGKSADTFKLVNPDNASDYAQLQLNYVNSIQTADLALSKGIADKDGNELDSTNTEYDERQFTFKLLLDLDGSGTVYDYKAYPVEYTIEGDDTVYTVDTNGSFMITKGEKITLKNIPVGAKFKLIESSATGFVPYQYQLNGGAKTAFSGTYEGTVSSTGNTLHFINKLNPSNTTVSVYKTLDDAAYTGSAFTYTMTGLGSMDTGYKDADNNAIMSVSRAGKSQTVTTPTADSTDNVGKVTFNSANLFSFTNTGYYRYMITEACASGTNTTEFKCEGTTIFVELEVGIKDGTDSETEVKSTTYYLIPKNTTIDSANYGQYFADRYKQTGAPTFKNTTQHGSVSIEKSASDTGNTKLQGTTFAIIKVAGDVTKNADGMITGADISLTTDEIKALISENSANLVKQVTGSDGVAKFENLVIFQDGSKQLTRKADNTLTWADSSNNYRTGSAVKQTYCVFEFGATDGYNLNYTPLYVQFPINSSYDVTESYIDAALVMPKTDGNGVNNWIILGLGLVGTGALLAAGYAMYDRRERKRRKARSARHTRL